mmetsp:Transcript_30996/g.80432  ORF Transcript_30996/g.80432 Transcript_30996/m.80432 type:complete len:160 (+) Transcript_30996:60-539(+)
MVLFLRPMEQGHALLSVGATGTFAVMAVVGHVAENNLLYWLGLLGGISSALVAACFLCQLATYGVAQKGGTTTVYSCCYCGMDFPTFDAAKHHEDTQCQDPAAPQAGRSIQMGRVVQGSSPVQAQVVDTGSDAQPTVVGAPVYATQPGPPVQATNVRVM